MAMSKKPVARKVAAKKASVKKGGAFDPRQPGYKKPGSYLVGSESTTGFGYRQTVKGSKERPQPTPGLLLTGTEKDFRDWEKANGKYKLPTGINPRAMKATSGNPKPTAKNMAAGKKATSVYKAKQAAAAKAAAIAKAKTAAAKANAIAKAKAKDAAAKAEAAKTAKKPTTGVYKRNPGS